MTNEAKWEVLTVAPDQLTAEMWRELLQQKGIPAEVNPADIASFMGVSSLPCRLIVAKSYLETAQQIMDELGIEGKKDDV
jgi:hypothetical protein